ncbi:hypothetical protein K469DRAFT_712118 [Zopfia rhizophila CBS 207.26]|uniref:Uncharacterized protein n=1 Tax=Zopfia rhizophila CBS 207.26 TaxID=1314779 RepID=A0A6A6EQW2_9PEZI|nr:hypothetical protein K469DRAFT_712118 [Zopfia rhizophila CBS 207.26]
MRVLQGTQVLESFDIQEKIESAFQVIDTMRQLNVQVRNEQLPISALVRCPLFALRYNLPDRKVRRLQLKFASNQDFDTAFNHLNRLGLRISQSVPPSSTNPAPSNTNKPESTGLSCPPSVVAEISNRPQTAISAQYSSTSSSSGPAAQPVSQRQENNSSIEQMRPHTMQSSISPQKAPIVPMYEQSTRQSDEYRPQPQSSPTATHRSFTLPPRSQQGQFDFARPASAYSALVNQERSAQLSPQPQALERLAPPQSFQKPAISSLGPASISNTATRENFPKLQIIQENELSSSARPGTALLFSELGATTAPMPPRRELPFKRSSPPKSSGSDNIRPSSRASNSTVVPPPLLPPSRSDDTSSSPNRLMSRALDLPPLPQPTLVAESTRGTSAHSFQTHHLTVNTQGPGLTRPLGVLNTAAQNSRQFQHAPTTASIQPSNNPETAYQDRIASHISAEARSSSNEHLATYAMQSVDGRMAFLNDFMMQHIEDDDFLTLCEDLSTCWRRIGLGLD